MKKLLLTISALTVLMTSCKKEVVSCIQMDNTTSSTTSPIVFTSCSENTLSYIWSFSGPAGAPANSLQFSEPIFDHTFTVPGTYTVELVAYERYSWIGDQSTATATFTIN